MPIETYEQAVAFWNSRINYEKIGMPQDVRLLKLDRMRALLEALGNPHLAYRTIHVTGTKGKGSTATMIASVLQAAGYRTGLYTSPHLMHVEERVQIYSAAPQDGELTTVAPPIHTIDRESMTNCMALVAQACVEVERQGEMPPTFFEIITAMGMLHFARQEVEFAVLEVGMGGRFDATNVVMPEVSVITSISIDHVEHLGDTLEKIAYEKAGIIKPGVPVVTGRIAEGPAAVIERVAQEQGSPLYRETKEFLAVQRKSNDPIKATVGTWLVDQNHNLSFVLQLPGAHQAHNAAVAIQTIKLLELDEPIDNGVVYDGLFDARIPGRLEIIGDKPLRVLDAAHNEASIQVLLDWLATLGPRTLHLLFAVSRDKQIRDMLQLLQTKFEHIIFTRYSSSSRGADPHYLLDQWMELSGTTGEVVEPAPLGWERLVQRAKPNDIVVATGSVFLVGEIRERYRQIDDDSR
ncbi:MAG: folylpolyglutamate synthase/dihydrofolate synthase family protein [Gemmatales bacterium]